MDASDSTSEDLSSPEPMNRSTESVSPGLKFSVQNILDPDFGKVNDDR